jgi:outer membrane biosynthesis protein TonB
MPSRLGMGGGSHKLDTQDESLFPDLAAADAILEQQKEKPAYSVAKKTPVGGGATWGSKPKPKKAKPEKPKEEQTPEPAKEEASAPTPAQVPKPVEASVPKSSVKPKKKKKKDLATFKPSS